MRAIDHAHPVLSKLSARRTQGVAWSAGSRGLNVVVEYLPRLAVIRGREHPLPIRPGRPWRGDFREAGAKDGLEI